MSYTIYSHIDTKTFEELKHRINLLKVEFEAFFRWRSFNRTRRYEDEVLGLDYVSQKDGFHGNIGFLFEDKPSPEPTFYFYYLKAYDLDDKRYYYKSTPLANVTLKHIEENWEEIITGCYEAYLAVKKEEMKADHE